MTIRAVTSDEYNTTKKDYLLQPFDVRPIEEYERHWSSNDNVAVAKNIKSSNHGYKCDVVMTLWQESPAFLTSMIHQENK